MSSILYLLEGCAASKAISLSYFQLQYQWRWTNPLLGRKAANVLWPTLLILQSLYYSFHLAKRQKMGTVT